MESGCCAVEIRIDSRQDLLDASIVHISFGLDDWIRVLPNAAEYQWFGGLHVRMCKNQKVDGRVVSPGRCDILNLDLYVLLIQGLSS